MLLPSEIAPSIEQRLQGFRLALERVGCCFIRAENTIETQELTYYAAHAAISKFLRRKTPLTALFCANDEMAAGALRAAHEAGVRVPDDLSLIGFDDIAMSSLIEPPLTTIGVDKEKMGRRAMARLIELVEGSDQRPNVELGPVELVVRGTTAKPHR
jgi:LacI family transcriptional regulator